MTNSNILRKFLIFMLFLVFFSSFSISYAWENGHFLQFGQEVNAATEYAIITKADNSLSATPIQLKAVDNDGDGIAESQYKYIYFAENCTWNVTGIGTKYVDVFLVGGGEQQGYQSGNGTGGSSIVVVRWQANQAPTLTNSTKENETLHSNYFIEKEVE